MLTKFVPAPPNSGGKLRSLALLTRLAERGPTALCAFDDGTADLEALAELGVEVHSVPWRPSLGRTLPGLVRARSATAARFWESTLHRRLIAATASPPDLLQVEYAQLLPYTAHIRARLRVLDLHNVESALVRSMAAPRRLPERIALEFEARRLRSMERTALQRFDAVAVVSELDRARLPQGSATVLVCPNGWTPDGPLERSSEQVVVFVGLLGWHPNADAARWLAGEVWPAVRRRVPGAELLLVGRDPPPSVVELAGNGVVVTGSVADVRPYLARAQVATAPLRIGGGSRLKVLEALGAGRPVVATTLGAEGLEDLVGTGIIIADSASSTADALVDLLNDPERAQGLGLAGHAAVRDRYSWDATLQPLLDFVDRRVGSGGR